MQARREGREIFKVLRGKRKPSPTILCLVTISSKDKNIDFLRQKLRHLLPVDLPYKKCQNKLFKEKENGMDQKLVFTFKKGRPLEKVKSIQSKNTHYI